MQKIKDIFCSCLWPLILNGFLLYLLYINSFIKGDTFIAFSFSGAVVINYYIIFILLSSWLVKQIYHQNILNIGVYLFFFYVVVSLIYNFQKYIYFHPFLRSDYHTLLFLFLFVFFGMVGYLWLLAYSIQKLNAENFFMFSYIILGLLYLLLFMPWSTPDAGAHFIASYRYSNILEHTMDWVGRFDDVNFFNRIIVRTVYNNNYSRDYEKLFADFKIFIENPEIVQFARQETKMEVYSFFCYLPQILGFFLGRMFSLSAVFTCYISRLTTYLVYLIFYLRAIKSIPFYKNIIAFIGLLPISLMISSSFSYDVMVMLVTMNFIAVIFGIYVHDKKTSLWECAIWSFLLGAVKAGGYIILLPLVFILWDKTDKRKNIGLLGIVFLGIFSICYFDLYLTKDMQFFQIEAQDNYHLSAKFAFEHPIEYLRMYVNTFYVQGLEIFTSMIGSRLSWWESTIPYWIVLGIFWVISICCIFEKYNIQLSKLSYFLILGIFVIFILTMPIMLLSYTSVGSSYIEGIQGRYYLPILPLFLIIVSANKGTSWNKWCQKYGDIIEQRGYVIYALFSVLAVIYIFNLYMYR